MLYFFSIYKGFFFGDPTETRTVDKSSNEAEKFRCDNISTTFCVFLRRFFVVVRQVEIELFDGLDLRLFSKIRIDIHGSADLRVTEQVLGGLGINAALKQDRSV